MGTGTAQQINRAKLLHSSKILKKCMGTKCYVLIPPHNIKQFTCETWDISVNQPMNVQSESPGGVLKKWFNLGQNM